MVYLNIKNTGKKKIYSLRKSIRNGKKIISKQICNLGNDPTKIILRLPDKILDSESQKSRKIIKKKLIKEILYKKIKGTEQKENKYFNKNQNYEIKTVMTSYKKFSLKKRNEFIEETLFNFVYENPLLEQDDKKNPTKKESREILKEKILTRNRSIIQIKYLINTQKILEFLNKNKPKINTKLLVNVQNKLVENYIRSGGLRTKNIKISKSKLKPSKPENIKSELKKLISWYNKNKTKIPPLALVVLFHNKFEKIHPFMGLNGQVGRIIMNYQLQQLGYPPIIIPSKKKEEYHNAMNKAYPCLKNDLLNTDMRYYSELMDFMHKQFVKTYWDNFVI